MPSPQSGAWELESDTQQGVLVCEDTHYSVVIAPKNLMRSDAAEPSAEDAMYASTIVAALAGTYTVSGSRVTLGRLASIRAPLVGIDLVAGFSVEVEMLTLRVASGSPVNPVSDCARYAEGNRG